MWAENVRRNASLAAMSEISGSMGSRTGFIKEESVFCLLPDSLDRLARVNNEHVFRDMTRVPGPWISKDVELKRSCWWKTWASNKHAGGSFVPPDKGRVTVSRVISVHKKLLVVAGPGSLMMLRVPEKQCRAGYFSRTGVHIAAREVVVFECRQEVICARKVT